MFEKVTIPKQETVLLNSFILLQSASGQDIRREL